MYSTVRVHLVVKFKIKLLQKMQGIGSFTMVHGLFCGLLKDIDSV